MRVALDIEMKSDSTGPWAEVTLIPDDPNIAPVPVVSLPVNPRHIRDTPATLAVKILADMLREALRREDT